MNLNRPILFKIVNASRHFFYGKKKNLSTAPSVVISTNNYEMGRTETSSAQIKFINYVHEHACTRTLNFYYWITNYHKLSKILLNLYNLYFSFENCVFIELQHDQIS